MAERNATPSSFSLSISFVRKVYAQNENILLSQDTLNTFLLSVY